MTTWITQQSNETKRGFVVVCPHCNTGFVPQVAFIHMWYDDTFTCPSCDMITKYDRREFELRDGSEVEAHYADDEFWQLVDKLKTEGLTFTVTTVKVGGVPVYDGAYSLVRRSN